MYVSDHPLSPYLKTLAARVTHFSHQLAEAGDREKVVVAGMVDRFRLHQTKNGNSMGFATLEDLYGKIDLVIFPQVWESIYHLVEIDHVLQAEGVVDSAQGDPKILVDKLLPVRLEDLSSETSAPNPENPPFTPDKSFLDEFLPNPTLGDDPTFSSKPGTDQASIQSNQAAAVPAKTPAQEQPDVSDPDPSQNEGHPDQDPPSPMAVPGPDPHWTTSAGLAQPDTEDKPAVRPPQVREAAPPPNTYHMLRRSIPKADPLPNPDLKPRRISITINSCGDKQQDVRRLRRLHDILVSRPGHDRFAFLVRENNYLYEIDFPNATTGLTEPLIHKLEGLMGGQNIDIAQIS